MLPKEVILQIEELKIKHTNIQFIVLYGSYAIGHQKRWSDVDIGVYFKGKHAPHFSKIININGHRLVSFICRNLDEVKHQLKDPYNWIFFVKRIYDAKLIYQKDRSFYEFKSFIDKYNPKPKDFPQYTSKFLADVLEYLGKTRNTDEKRLQKKYAITVAISCFWLLTPLNSIAPYDNKNECRFYLQLKRKPKTFDDLLTNILLEKSKNYQQDARKLARDTIQFAQKQGILKKCKVQWVQEITQNNLIYKLL